MPLPSAYELKARYLGGETRDALAQAFKVNQATVVRALSAMGVKTRDGGLTKRPLRVNGKTYPGVLAAMKGENLGHKALLAAAVFL
jgi:hypothetical protein